MQINLLKDIVEDIAGKQAREIVDLLAGKKDVNEFLIAKKLKLTINQTRNILYKLGDSGLVSFTRKKDKRKGWYIYFWTLSTIKSLSLLEKKLAGEMKQIKSRLIKRKTKRFYFCETCNIEVSEDTALLNNFTCQECGQVYKLSENDKVIKELEGKLSKLGKNVNIIKEEREKEEEKKDKKTRRKAAREERKKKAARRKARKKAAAKRKKEKIKEEKKVKKNLRKNQRKNQKRNQRKK